MKNKARSFPYPVLSSFSDDILNSKFEIKIDSLFVENDNYKLIGEMVLENDDLENLISNRQACYWIDLECDTTLYKQTDRVYEKMFELTIPSEKVDRLTDFSIYVVANENIEGYHNKDFHPDYNDYSFNILEGDRLAMTPTIMLKTLYKPVAPINSIFVLLKDDELDNDQLIVSYIGQDKIEISVSTSNYNLYKHLERDKVMKNVLHSLTLIPALMEVLYGIREGEIEEFKGLNWYQSINKRFEQIGKNLEKFIEDEDDAVIEVAYQLIDSSIHTSLTELVKDTEEDSEDEEDEI